MRKSWMKRIAAIFVGVLLLTGCGQGTQNEDASDAPSNAETAIADGTYEGVGEGYHGEIKVAVSLKDDKIEKVEILEHSETEGVSDPAREQIPEAIVAEQSILVDSVSGCTKTSEGIKEAVKAALLTATSDISVFEKDVAKKEGSTELLEKSADIVIVGAGGAGLTAANEALDAGSSVIVLDKQPQVGGNTILAGSAMNSSDPERQKNLTMTPAEHDMVDHFLGLEAKNEMMQSWQETLQNEWDAYNAEGRTDLFDSPSLHKLQTYVDGDYVAKPELVDYLCEHSLEALHWMEAKGTQWQDTVNAAVGATWRRSHTPSTEGGLRGAQFVKPQEKYARENGAEILTDTKAEHLIVEEGRVVGVTGTKTDGQPFEIRANQAVIMATGGFSANVDMRVKYNTEWDVIDDSIPTTNGPQATGDGIVMAEEAGAQLIDMEKIQILPTWGGTITTYIENQIYVNQNGERFVHEDGRRDELSRAFLAQPGSYGYIVNDSKLVDENGFTVVGKNVNEMIEAGKLLKGDTIEELAEAIGCPAENLQASIDQFNASVDGAEDPFGRAVFDQKIDQGPFYAGKTSPAVHHTMGGISINEKAQVLDTNGQVIPGFYAAGEVTGGIHGGNRLGGNAITDIAVFGRVAGMNAAKEQ